ncbi:MAG TPA: hypothetical protein VNI79_06115 [Sphingomicrobium sp.]|nr:hypothetical protein [Sphingomicrobium sp.]
MGRSRGKACGAAGEMDRTGFGEGGEEQALAIGAPPRASRLRLSGSATPSNGSASTAAESGSGGPEGASKSVGQAIS